MNHCTAHDSFRDEIEPHLHKCIGREVRSAQRVLDLGCGSYDLVRCLTDVVAKTHWNETQVQEA